jgi:hypothetical protein
VVQAELIPELGKEVEGLTPKLEKLIHTLEWVRSEEFVPGWQGLGRPPKDRGALAKKYRKSGKKSAIGGCQAKSGGFTRGVLQETQVVRTSIIKKGLSISVPGNYWESSLNPYRRVVTVAISALSQQQHFQAPQQPLR